MSGRYGLVALQALGAVSILPYPAILVANVMAIAGEGPRGMQRVIRAIPFVLLSLYPLLWIALDKLSWRAMGQGNTGWAFLMSAIPVVASMVALGVFFASDAPTRKYQDDQTTAIRARVEKANPLVWTLLCAGGSQRIARPPKFSVGDALKAIQQSSTLNDPVPEYGTPLNTALHNLTYNYDGTPYDGRQKGLEQLVRALVARGAQLSTKETQDLRSIWLLKRAAFDGPIATRSENPLVWRILKTADPRDSDARNGILPTLQPADAPLLNKATQLHGTPLYAALLVGSRLAGTLIEAGARLAPAESTDPAAMLSLGKLFQDQPHLREVYEH